MKKAILAIGVLLGGCTQNSAPAENQMQASDTEVSAGNVDSGYDANLEATPDENRADATDAGSATGGGPANITASTGADPDAPMKNKQK
jgi:PBP1b-binding outer membrane lipoprotein LpoB